MFSSTRTRIALAFAIFVVLAVALVPAAGARTGAIQPSSPWYARDAAVRQAQHKAQLSRIPANPWYAHDAAVRALQHKRHAK